MNLQNLYKVVPVVKKAEICSKNRRHQIKDEKVAFYRVNVPSKWLSPVFWRSLHIIIILGHFLMPSLTKLMATQPGNLPCHPYRKIIAKDKVSPHHDAIAQWSQNLPLKTKFSLSICIHFFSKWWLAASLTCLFHRRMNEYLCLHF